MHVWGVCGHNIPSLVLLSVDTVFCGVLMPALAACIKLFPHGLSIALIDIYHIPVLVSPQKVNDITSSY